MSHAIQGDGYETPEGLPRRASELLFLGTRWSPYFQFFGVMFRERALALRGLYDDEAWAESSLEILERLEGCGARFSISGLSRLSSFEGPAVIVSNHMSTLETLILPGLVAPRKPCTFVVKVELLHGPIWGPIMRSRDPIAVTRKDARRDLETVLGEGRRLLSSGRSVVVFPQATRRDVFSRAEFNSIGAKLASRAGVPLLPVAVKTDYWGNSPLFRGFGPVRRDRRVHIEFGEPMPVSGRGKAEHEASVDFIESRLRAWGAPIAET